MDQVTIFQDFSNWVSQNWAASAIIGGALWDVVDKQLWMPFQSKFTKFFKDEIETKEYFKIINNTKTINEKKPYRDIEDVYEELTQKKIPQEFIDELTQFLISNKDTIEMINKEKGDFSSLNQNAGRDINNVKGSQTIINNGRC